MKWLSINVKFPIYLVKTFTLTDKILIYPASKLISKMNLKANNFMVEYTDPLHKSKMGIIRFLYHFWSQVEEIDSHWRLHQRIEKQI